MATNSNIFADPGRNQGVIQNQIGVRGQPFTPEGASGTSTVNQPAMTNAQGT